MEKHIFYNGRIFTLDATLSRAEAVLVEDGRVAAVGTTEEILLQGGRADVPRTDLEGAYVYPGLTDSHLHLMGHGMKLSMLDLSKVRSKEELLRAVRERAAKTPAEKWVLGMNWDENRFSVPEPPTREELDRISPERPVMLTRICHHVQAVNSAALRAAGLSRNTPDPSDGKYGRDERGDLNGLVYENASKPLFDAIPNRSPAERMEFARLGARDALAKGLTGVHTEDLRSAESVDALLRIYRGLREEGIFLRTHHLVYHPFLREYREAGLKPGEGDRWVRFGAVKLFADGSFGGRTALLSRPYADDPSTRGFAVHTQERLEAIVREAREARMPVAVHAIGDQAAEMVIRALEKHPLTKGEAFFRDRLIHAQVLREDLLERMERLPLAVDIQPRFVAGDFPWVADRLPEALLPTSYAWKTLIRRGVPAGGGSDAPIEPVDPLLGMHAAVTRHAPGEEHGGYGPEQKLTPSEALRLFTLGSAFAAGEEAERGTVTPGKYADLSIFDRDLLSGDPDDFLKARTLFTVVNGRTAYRA
ncbi:hypothetical protein C8P63_12827 [Melghirimyces profundicolus]|uniref:Amidohydrolase 3 domain-containing protein n=1 Tax=Melghirimyces profundicolus TaxID=1242148 RepID=A0A2T6BCA0_9BACL|nr:amidohydrolase [Melghirimyces profundicolus]PTX53664.1 hypothetical protein C8P63_12827 [Melghirimyces profundicolus]